MKKVTKGGLCCALLLFVGSMLFGQSNFNIQKGGHSYRIEVPDYMSRVYDLNEVATLQYMDPSLPAYVIVIDDSKNELAYYDIFFAGARDFLQSFIENFQVNSEERKVGEILDFVVGASQYSQVRMNWKEGENHIFMMITAIETPTHFYKVLCWTLYDLRDRLMDDFLRISTSLRDERSGVLQE